MTARNLEKNISINGALCQSLMIVPDFGILTLALLPNAKRFVSQNFMKPFEFLKCLRTNAN